MLRCHFNLIFVQAWKKYRKKLATDLEKKGTNAIISAFRVILIFTHTYIHTHTDTHTYIYARTNTQFTGFDPLVEMSEGWKGAIER